MQRDTTTELEETSKLALTLKIWIGMASNGNRIKFSFSISKKLSVCVIGEERE